MFKIAICDDEQAICQRIEDIILNLSKVIAETIETEVFYSGERLIKHLQQGEHIDLIFLDIELERMNGVEVGKFIRERLNNNIIQIIYVSAMSSYAMELFAVRPFDFILKPLQEKDVQAVLNKALKLIKQSNIFFTYMKHKKIYKQKIQDIYYFESKNRMIRIVKRDGIDFFYSKMDEVINQIQDIHFLHIHKSYLINYMFIKRLEYNQVTMINDRVLPISQGKRAQIRNLQIIYEQERMWNNGIECI